MITYEIGNKLYLNITNRCTNRCKFCVRKSNKGLGFDLWLKEEPDLEEIIKAVGSAEKYDEVVFCGYGEPLIRLPEVIEISKHLKRLEKKVRINTNGQSDAIWKRPTVKELSGLVDAVSISLNASNEALYQELCQSEFGEGVLKSILSFTADCVRYLPEVTLTVVDLIPEDDIQKCALIAKELGANFKVRKFLEL